MTDEASAHSAEIQTAGEEAAALAPDSIQQDNSSVETIDQGGSGEVETPQATETTPDINQRIEGVNDIDGYAAMEAEILNNPNAFEDQTPQEPTQEAADAPQEEQAPQEPAQEAAAPEQDQVTGGNDEVEEGQGDKKPPQFRLRPANEVDAEALRIMKAAEIAETPIKLDEALAIAKKQLGIEDQVLHPSQDSQDPDYEGDEENAEESPEDTVTLAEAKQELRDLRNQLSQAMRDGDLDEAADINQQIMDAEDLVEVVSERETREEEFSREQHDQTFESSVEQATNLYPDFGNDESEFYDRCKEIDQALHDTGDPRYFDAEKPLMIAQIAAKELNIAPGSASRKPAAAQAAAQPQPQQTQQTSSPQPPRTERPGQIPAASGASRTAGAPTGAAASLAEQVTNISSPEAFERLAAQVHAATR